MNSKLFPVIVIGLFSLTLNTLCAQVAINNSATNPDPSAILDLNSGNTGVNKGFLAPQVSLTNVTVTAPVISPATGLIVYSTTAPSGGNGAGYYYWNGSAWSTLSTIPTSLPPNGTAGGNLNGTYPNPTVSEINGASVQAAGSLTTGNVLQVNGASSTTYAPINIGGGANYITGNLPVTNLNNGTGASANTFWCGNGTWVTPSTSATAWQLKGNSGTTAGTDYIGTNDAASFEIRVNGQISGYIDYNKSVGNASFGLQAMNINTGTDNSAFGSQSMYDNTTGSYNVSIGTQALYANTIGAYNTANGSFALNENTLGSYNTATGSQALSFNTSGNNNTANGYSALMSNTTGSFNTATGYQSLYNNSGGADNTGNGYFTLGNNTTGSYNTANGYEALYKNNSSYNDATGYEALYSNTAGASDVADGYQALYSNTAGSYNTAIGYQALYSNTTTTYNTALGYQALYSNTAGSNTGIGYQALYGNTTGVYNTAIGLACLLGNTTGNNNTASGYDALGSNTTGNNNTACGISALVSNTTGNNNTAYGMNALLSNTTGINNTANGYYSLGLSLTASSNTANGFYALYKNTADKNTSTGDSSSYNNTSGAYNTATGYAALASNTTGSYNTAIGYGADVANNNLNNTTAIGYGALADNNNSIALGNTAVVFCGINGAGYNASNALMVGNSALNGNGAYLTVGGVWTNTSDRNKKENFTTPSVSGLLTKITMLPILEWNYKGEPSTVKHIGPMAQDFYRIFQVGNDSVSISTIDPAGIALAGVQALNQKLEAENEKLKTQISQLTENQNARFLNDEKEIAELKTILLNMNQAQASTK